MAWPEFSDLTRIGGLLALGAAGGFAASALGLPMPYLLGSLAVTAAVAMTHSARTGRTLGFPQSLRKAFVAVIGVMIGATFSRELVAVLPSLWLVLVAMAFFVFAAQGIGYAIFRYVGRHDPVTALFAGMPGGLIEAVALGEQAGGDVRAISVQQFARVVLVVTTVPLLFLLASGEAVGSAAGQSFETGTWGALDLSLIALIAAAGVWLGLRLRLPAPPMMGPLLVSAALHASGAVDTASPGWLLALAQLVIGVGLGTLFSGASPRQLGQAFGLGAMAVAAMLALAGGLALALERAVPLEIGALFISLAPGGVTEMGLIALTLGTNPVVVAAGHLFRITLTVVVAGVVTRHLMRRAAVERKDEPPAG